MKCDACGGTGDESKTLVYQRCSVCKGKGRVERMFTYAEVLTLCEHSIRAGYSLGRQNTTVDNANLTYRCKNIIGEP